MSLNPKKTISFGILTLGIFLGLVFYIDQENKTENDLTSIDSQSYFESHISTPITNLGIKQTFTLSPKTEVLIPVTTDKFSPSLINNAYGSLAGDTLSVTSTEAIVPTSSAGLKSIVNIPVNQFSVNKVFTEKSTNKIGHLNSGYTTFNEWTLPNASSGPNYITASSLSQYVVYFTENPGNRIGKLDTQTGALTEWTVPTADAGLEDIGIDSFGNIFVIEKNLNKIGQLNTSTNEFTEWTVPTSNAGLESLVVDSTNKIYFSEVNSNKIGRLTPTANAFVEWAIPTPSSGISKLSKDSTDNVYFAEKTSNKIAKLNPGSNTFTEWTVPTPNSQPNGIGWCSCNSATKFVIFTEENSNKIGRLNLTTNVITEWTIPTPSSSPGDLDVAADHIHFIEQNTNTIGKIV